MSVADERKALGDAHSAWRRLLVDVRNDRTRPAQTTEGERSAAGQLADGSEAQIEDGETDAPPAAA